MKKALLSLLIIIPFLSFSQEKQKISVGVVISPSLTNIRGTNFLPKYYEKTLGYLIGASFNYTINNTISLQTDLSFERKGAVLNVEGTNSQGAYEGQGFKAHSNFDYLTIPLLARATFGSKVKFFINAGPFVGFLISQKETTKASGFPTSKIDYTSLYQCLDAGITAGVGLSVPMNERFSVSLEGRNNLGLVDINKYSGSVMTNSTNFLIGVVYHL